MSQSLSCLNFFFNDTATTEIYTLSLHDALPICQWGSKAIPVLARSRRDRHGRIRRPMRSEEHTSELQSHLNLVCRLLLEKKKTIKHPVPLAVRDSRLLNTSKCPSHARVFSG